MKKIKHWDLNGQLMATAAHRYCLGRQSYIVGACIDWVRSNLKYLERNTVRVIARDTLEAIIDESAGSKIIDEPGWMRLFKELYAHMQQEDRDWVLQAVHHRNHAPRYNEVMKEVVGFNNNETK